MVWTTSKQDSRMEKNLDEGDEEGDILDRRLLLGILKFVWLYKIKIYKKFVVL